MLTKFQFHCSITCRDILYFVFWLPYCHTLWRHQYLICIIQKSWISLVWDEIWQKGKRHSSSLLKAFQIRLFFNTSIFHFIGTLSLVYLCCCSLATLGPQQRRETQNLLSRSKIGTSMHAMFNLSILLLVITKFGKFVSYFVTGEDMWNTETRFNFFFKSRCALIWLCFCDIKNKFLQSN